MLFLNDECGYDVDFVTVPGGGGDLLVQQGKHQQLQRELL